MLRFLLSLGLLALPSGALACGIFFPALDASPTAMDAQKALLVFGEATVDVHISVRAEGAGDDFVWVLPVADHPLLSLGSAEVFTSLESLTNPSIEVEQEVFSGGDSSFLGCGVLSTDMEAGGARNGAGSAPLVVESGTLGEYEYDIIKPTTSEGMTTWLTENGYAVPDGTSDVLAPYVNAGMSFVWVKLGPKTEGLGLSDIRPLVLTVPRPVTGEVMFPLALSAGSAQDVMGTHIYTLAEQRYRVTNYASMDLQGLADAYWDLRWEDLSYEALLDQVTTDAGGRLMVTEFARDLRVESDLPASLAQLMDDSAFYLTRLHARTRPEHLADAQLSFAHGAGEVSNTAMASSQSRNAGFPLALFAVLLGLLGWSRRAASA